MQDNKNRTVQPKSKPNHFGAYLLVPTYWCLPIGAYL
jgi:hypothetical protein